MKMAREPARRPDALAPSLAPRPRSHPVSPLRHDEVGDAPCDITDRQRLALTTLPVLDLGVALLEPTRPEDDLVGDKREVLARFVESDVVMYAR